MSALLRPLLAFFAALSLGLAPPLAPGAGATDGRLTLLGQFVYPTKADFQGTTVGGLSGLTYDAQRNVYYVLSDDRGENQPARFYTMEIEIGPGGIKDVRVVGVTTLDSDANTPGVQPYEKNEIDPEEIVLLPDRTLLVSSERDSRGRPWLRRFNLDGTLLGELPLPERFLPDSQPGPDGKPVQVRGVRNNLGFEGVALLPDGKTLYAANEEALAQDGSISTLEAGTVVRILRFDLGAGGWQPGPEVAYRTDKISRPPDPPTAFADNGISALLWVGQLWPDFDLLAMERSFSTGVGNDVALYGVKLAGAARTETLAALPAPYTAAVASKTLLVRMSDIGVEPDNLEGLVLGPRLPNGKPSLLVISDDNFSIFQPPQINQFLLFELNDTIAQTPAPAASPVPTLAPTPAPVRPAGPAQVPSALPRTGLAPPDGSLAALGLALLGLGLRLRRRRV